ncbi:MAG: cytochrome-c peroxidase [Saprospiraceae bacterium]
MKKKLFSIAIIAFIGIVTLCFKINNTPKPYTFPKLNYFPKMPLKANNPVTEEGVELGRHLFYDPILSRDSTISCGSCHRQEVAFSDSPKQFSTGIDNQKSKRNAMPLFNLAWYPSLFWDGRAANIELQALHPVSASDEMDLEWQVAVERVQSNHFYIDFFEKAFPNQTIDSLLIIDAIGQFERTLISHQSKYDSVILGTAAFTKDEFEGFLLVNEQDKGNCLHCHTTDADALGTTRKFANNGLDFVRKVEDFKDLGKGGFSKKNSDMGLFKIPSLRNVALTPPYMHDGRFETLEEVVHFYNKKVQLSPTLDKRMTIQQQKTIQLTPKEERQIVVFLHTLSDFAFTKDEAFSNPFKNK